MITCTLPLAKEWGIKRTVSQAIGKAKVSPKLLTLWHVEVGRGERKKLS